MRPFLEKVLKRTPKLPKRVSLPDLCGLVLDFCQVKYTEFLPDETAATEVFLPHIEGGHVGVGVGPHHRPVHDVAGGQDWGDWGGQQGTTGELRVRVRPHTTVLVTTT